MEGRNAYESGVGKVEGRDCLRDLDVDANILLKRIL